MTMDQSPPRPSPSADRSHDRRWRLTAGIGLVTLVPVYLLAIAVMLSLCGVADNCGDPPAALEYFSWAAFSVSVAAGLFASLAPKRFRWSQRARPCVTLLQLLAAAVAVGAVLLAAP